MAAEIKATLELGDILTFRIRCSGCSSEISYSLTGGAVIPERCPMCSTSWFSSKSPSPVARMGYEHFQGLVQALRFFRGDAALKVLKLRFEVDAEILKS